MDLNQVLSISKNTLTPLIKKGYEVLAFDAPAHGESTGKTINAVVYKDLVLIFGSSYGPIDSFVTHSFGGLALVLALEEIPHAASHKNCFDCSGSRNQNSD